MIKNVPVLINNLIINFKKYFLFSPLCPFTVEGLDTTLVNGNGEIKMKYIRPIFILLISIRFELSIIQIHIYS